MFDSIVVAIFWTLAAYLAIGVCFAVVFVIRGVRAIDPVAATSPLSFRVILLPGAAALWPLLVHLWINAEKKS